LAAVLLTFTGLAFLRSESLTKKWQRKLKKALKNHKAFENVDVNVNMKNQEHADAPVATTDGAEGRDLMMSEEGANFKKEIEQESPTSPSATSTSNIIVAEESKPIETNQDNSNETYETNEAVGKKSVDGNSESSDRTLVKTINKSDGAWAIFMIPFVTVLREGLEGVVFILGISLGAPYGHIPLAVVTGILCVRSPLLFCFFIEKYCFYYRVLL
jgi:high-affinity iron transporter